MVVGSRRTREHASLPRSRGKVVQNRWLPDGSLTSTRCPRSGPAPQPVPRQLAPFFDARTPDAGRRSGIVHRNRNPLKVGNEPPRGPQGPSHVGFQGNEGATPQPDCPKKGLPEREFLA